MYEGKSTCGWMLDGSAQRSSAGLIGNAESKSASNQCRGL